MHGLITVPEELVIVRLRVVTPETLENGMAGPVTPQPLGIGAAQTSQPLPSSVAPISVPIGQGFALPVMGNGAGGDGVFGIVIV